MKIQDTIKKLNADISDAANQEKAKSLRKKLLGWGIALAILGFGGAFVCFCLFAVFSMNFSMNYILIPFLLIIPCFAIGIIGSMLIYFGLAIVIAGTSSKFIDKSVSYHCPNCNKLIFENDLFCSSCGKSLKRKCKNCGTINEPDSSYCKSCGERI